MKNGNGLIFQIASLVIIIGLVGCSKKEGNQNSNASGENVILSKVGSSCAQPGNEMHIFLRDTVIPNESKITVSQVCDMVNDMHAAEVKTTKKVADDYLNGEDGICKLAEKAYTKWGYERSLELTQMGVNANQGGADENSARMLYGAVRICHSNKTKEEFYKGMYSGRTYGLFSVGTIINPTTKKSCPAYLVESTVQSNRRGVTAVMYPLRALNCDGIDLTAYEKPVDMRGHNLKDILKYSGALPEYYINLDGDRIPFYSPNSQGKVASNVSPEQANASPLTEEKVKSIMAEFLKTESERLKKDEPNVQASFSASEILIGDLDADGSPEEAVVIWSIKTSTIQTSRVAVVYNTRNDPQIAHPNDGIHGNVEHVSIENGLLAVDVQPLSSPGTRVKVMMKLANGVLVKINGEPQLVANRASAGGAQPPSNQNFDYTDGQGRQYTASAVANGMTLKSSEATITLHKSCTAASPQYGDGNWDWANGGFRVVFKAVTISFPRQEISMDGIGGCRS